VPGDTGPTGPAGPPGPPGLIECPDGYTLTSVPINTPGGQVLLFGCLTAG
jgi:hypothetical protein